MDRGHSLTPRSTARYTSLTRDDRSSYHQENRKSFRWLGPVVHIDQPPATTAVSKKKKVSSMELKIGSPELARALGRSQGIVERKSTMPILSHVLLEAKKGNELHISATDLDLSVTSTHGCEVAEEGALAVSAKHLYEIVRSLPEQTVSLKKAGNNYLEVRSGPSEFRIVGLPAEDFPALPRFEKSGLRRRRPEVTARPDRADLLRRLERRDPLQPERRLLRAPGRGAAAGGHRRPPARRLGAAAGRRLRPQEGRHPPEEGAPGAHASCSPRRPSPGEEKPEGPGSASPRTRPSSGGPASSW